MSKKLEAIPSIGPLGASALVTSISDPHIFRSGRDVSAWIGIVPKQNSSGGKERLGSISKAGNRYLRKLLVDGALAIIKRVKQLGYTRYPWLTELMERRFVKVAAIALANSEHMNATGPSECANARTVWATMARNESYRVPKTASA